MTFPELEMQVVNSGPQLVAHPLQAAWCCAAFPLYLLKEAGCKASLLSTL